MSTLRSIIPSTGFGSSKHQRALTSARNTSNISRSGRFLNHPTVFFLLSRAWPQLPLSCRMRDSFIENNTWVDPLVNGLQTRGGRRKRVNGWKKRSLSVSRSFQHHIADGQLRKRSMWIYIGKEMKSRSEITFRATKGCKEASQLAFCWPVNIKRGI